MTRYTVRNYLWALVLTALVCFSLCGTATLAADTPPFSLTAAHAISFTGRGTMETAKAMLPFGSTRLGQLTVIGNVDVLFSWDDERPVWGAGISGTLSSNNRGVNVGVGWNEKLGWLGTIGWAF
jgi:hypothetical protein